MTRFNYTALNRTGEKISGYVAANTKADAVHILERMGLVPVSITTTDEPSTPAPTPSLKTYSQAVSSLVLGILSLALFFLGIPAVIFGHIALSQIRKQPQKIGCTAIACTGIIIGYLSMAFWFLSNAVPAFMTGWKRAYQTHTIVTNSQTHTSESGERFSDVLARSVSESMRESVREDRRRAEMAQPSSDFPNVLSVLGILYENEGITDTGRYSRDQQELIFSKRYKGNQYFVHGEITDVGTTAFGNRKYITLMVTKGHYFDVYPATDFDLLAYSKGQRIGFAGTWTSLGTGIIVKHKIEQADSPESFTRGQMVPATPRGPTAPYDQQEFVKQLREHQRQYREVQKLNNDLRLKDVAENASSFLETARNVSRWVGKAKGVNSGLFGTVWVDTDFDGVQYTLYPNDTMNAADSSLLTSLKMINKGDWIQFTGSMTGSTRLTKAGAVTDPAMRVVLMSVQTFNP
jgi:hypothetical protein